MNITRNNCESFFLDYYEKNLSPVEVAEVLFFLEENPELKDVFESYEAVFLEHEKVNFPDKESLKKKYSKEELDLILSSEITIHNCEQFFVAASENILSKEQAGKLNLFLAAHPELQKDFELIQKCKLIPEQIIFENKGLLKKVSINAQNREEYFVRSIENDLSPAEQKQLNLFLTANPEFKKELESFKQTILPQEKTNFVHKSSLKKEEINAANREEYFIRSLENDLNAAEQKQLTFFLQNNPGYAQELDSFKKTILVPERISFEHKEELKRKERRPVFISLFSQQRTYYAAAAAILLFAGLFFFFRSDDNKVTFVADKTSKTNVQPEKENNVVPEKEQETNDSKSLSADAAGQHPDRKRPDNSNSEQPGGTNREQVKEPEIIPQPVFPENKIEDPLIAKKEEPKKMEEVQVEAPVVALAVEKKDTAATAMPNEAVASAVSAAAKSDGYETVGSVVNKKLRSALGIKKSTDCKTSDKIDLWDLAMAAKKGVQKVIGAKTLDVQKVCDGKGESVEYVFTAGNFEISKSTSK